jgi:hypothetical protein
MKRAWPYALALAVVVTGCYLALAPLLRSLSPAPTTSANSLSTGSNTTTVGKSKPIVFRGPHGSNSFVTVLKKKAKAKKVTKAPVKATPKVSTTTPSSNTTGFANNPPSSSSSSTPKSTPTTPSSPTKTTNRKNSALGGSIHQGQGGDGFASPTDGGGTKVGGQTLAPGSN